MYCQSEDLVRGIILLKKFKIYLHEHTELYKIGGTLDFG